MKAYEFGTRRHGQQDYSAAGSLFTSDFSEGRMMLVTSLAQPSNVDRSNLLQLGHLLTQSAPAALLQNLVFGFRLGWFLSTAGCGRYR